MSEQQSAAKGTEVVFIGCKIPNGLILELGTPGDTNYARVHLAGPNSGAIAALDAGVTEVPKEFWEEWLGLKGCNGNTDLNPKLRTRQLNRELPFIKNRLVFECRSLTDANAIALELGGQKTGLEQLNPKKGAPGVVMDPDHESSKVLSGQRVMTSPRVAL